MKREIKLIRGKKGIPMIIMSVFYDLIFVALSILVLTAFLKAVDSNLIIWRQYYAEDIGLTLALVEGVPEDLTVTYVPNHEHMFSESEVKLMLEVSAGAVSLTAENDPNAATRRQFITRKGSALSIFAPLQSLTISKKDNKVNLATLENVQCESLISSKKNFIETSINIQNEYSGNVKYKDVSRTLDDFVYFMKEYIRSEYGNRLSSEEEDITDLRTILYNENIEDSVSNADIAIKFAFIYSDKNVIKVLYSENGFFSKQLSCVIANLFDNEYGDEFSIQNNKISQDLYNDFRINDETPTVLILLETDKFKSIADTTYEKKVFINKITTSILSMTKKFTQEELDILIENKLN